MNEVSYRESGAIARLRQALPLSAHGRPALLAFLRKRFAYLGGAPRLTVTNVFYAGDQTLMCQFTIGDATAGQKVFVAPLYNVALDRRHPVAREIGAQSSLLAKSRKTR
jgi:hypothetical protein